MVKYLNYEITFAEVPDEINLCINITNCQEHCHGCHSPILRQNIGADLNKDIQNILNKYQGQFTCVCFLGEGNDKKGLQQLISYIKNQNYKTCLYSGRDKVDFDDYKDLDYLKIGSYQERQGPLNNPKTNQRMFHYINHQWIDITAKFFPSVL